ncbi:uncharacterized protein LOC129767040 [Toxorhynchites rutilus septentrionalis]|uniref:uncharacterized protein LOC129767040 n=1 Tax=Toxorhynchites rutilus septentrionalis TaxID=329112 RepID=UPI002479E8C3|nr:uncharacterized protein LOC129767040 [Toxorhynchites rutilus septentrionalis]
MFKVGVTTYSKLLPEDYPNTDLTSAQLDSIQNALLTAIEQQRNEPVKPKFFNCSYKSGYLILSCKDHQTSEWLKKVVPGIILDDNIKLVALDAKNIPRPEILHAFFPQSATFSDKRLKSLIESQNENLSTDKWRILKRSNPNEIHADWTLTVDEASMRQLTSTNFNINFRFGGTKLRKTNPKQRQAIIHKSSGVFKGDLGPKNGEPKNSKNPGNLKFSETSDSKIVEPQNAQEVVRRVSGKPKRPREASPKNKKLGILSIPGPSGTNSTVIANYRDKKS